MGVKPKSDIFYNILKSSKIIRSNINKCTLFPHECPHGWSCYLFSVGNYMSLDMWLMGYSLRKWNDQDEICYPQMKHPIPLGSDGNRPIQAKCVASVTNCGLGLETAMAPTVNMGWQLFTNDKYRKSFSKIFHITWRQRLVFQLNDCVFPKDLTQ